MFYYVCLRGVMTSETGKSLVYPVHFIAGIQYCAHHCFTLSSSVVLNPELIHPLSNRYFALSRQIV